MTAAGAREILPVEVPPAVTVTFTLPLVYPVRLAVTVYAPGFTLAMEYLPDASVSTALVGGEVTTLALPSGKLVEASTTVPLIVPVVGFVTASSFLQPDAIMTNIIMLTTSAYFNL